MHHTLTAWRDADASRDYSASGAHRGAVAVFSKIAHGKIYSGIHVELPDWATARALWDTEGVVV